MKPVDCDFCGSLPSDVTLTRKRASGMVDVRLRLCSRCADLQQYVLLAQARPSPCCFHCGAPPAAEAESHGPDGRFLGRAAICASCAASAAAGTAAMLRVSTLWTPGVLALPPAQQRLFPAPPGRPPLPFDPN